MAETFLLSKDQIGKTGLWVTERDRQKQKSDISDGI